MLTKRKLQFPSFFIRDGEGNVQQSQFSNGELVEFTASVDKFYDMNIHPYGFFIVPLTAGKILTQLWGQKDGETYEFSAEEIDAHKGKMLPARVKAVFSSGTTVTKMKIVW